MAETANARYWQADDLKWYWECDDCPAYGGPFPHHAWGKDVEVATALGVHLHGAHVG